MIQPDTHIQPERRMTASVLLAVILLSGCMCACVRACVCACVHACVRACVRVCVYRENHEEEGCLLKKSETKLSANVLKQNHSL